MDAEQLLSAIQMQIDSDGSTSNGASRAVHFFPAEPGAQAAGPAGNDFNEDDYLISNPDIMAAIERGEFKSGFEHWTKVGSSEGRSFVPAAFVEKEYLESNPDAANAVLSGEFVSGRDHWLKRGRVEGRSVRKSMRAFVLSTMRLTSDRASRIGTVPEGPRTLRATVGKGIIRIMRRLLWWYTRSLEDFASSVTRQLQAQIAWLDSIEKEQRQDHGLIESLRTTITDLSADQRNLAFKADTLGAEVRSYSDFKRQFASAQEQDRKILQSIQSAVAQLSSEQQKLASRIVQWETDASSISELKRDFSATLARIDGLSGMLTSLQSNGASHNRFDALYFQFQEAFRGPRNEIKARQSVYLPFLVEAQAGSPERPILDLGCGRGEWIELLASQRMIARGVDENVAMIGFCRSMGLSVEHAECIEYLRALPDCSLGAVTSFHTIEHIPFEIVLLLLRESMRVLKPGGLLILETPNPKNLIVASHNFYLDPTHLKPLPPAMLRFFVEANGFSNCQVLELQPDSQRTACEDMAALKSINELLHGPQDYGVIARRP
jgi:SAM-dependent methyltransferase